MHADKTN